MRRSDWLLVTLFTAAAGVLRAIGLDQGLWFDEIVSLVEYIRPPAAAIVTSYASSNNHPLYSLLAHGAVSLLGEAAWTVRLPAFLFGIAAVPAVYLLGREVTDRRESLLAAALIAVSYHHIWFSQNARGYTALVFFTTACTWLLVRGWQSGAPPWFVAYGVVVALGIYTHLTMVFVAAGHGLVLAAAALAAARRAGHVPVAPAIAGFALAAAGAMLLYAPMAADVLAFFGGPPLETTRVATTGWAVRETLRGLRAGLGLLGVLAAAALFALGLWRYWREDRVVTGLFAIPGAVTLAGILLTGSPMRPRFFFFLVAFAVLIVIRGATAAGTLASRWAPATVPAAAIANAIAGAMVVVSVASLPGGYRHPKQDYEGAMKYVDASAPPGAEVRTAALAVYPYRQYYGRPWLPVSTARELEAAAGSGRPLIVLYTFPEYEDPDLIRSIRSRCESPRVFEATVAGGDIVVCALDRRQARREPGP